MSEDKMFIRENGDLKSKVTITRYGAELSTMRNGWQWSGQPINKQLALLIINNLKDYVKDE